MKKLYIFLIVYATIILTSCNGISPETAKAFVGEYWMETTTVGIERGEEYPLNEKSSWSPVSIYEKDGKLYVQTELFGAPDTESEHPKEIEVYKDRPAFTPLRKLLADEGGENTGGQGIENLEGPFPPQIIISSGCIVCITNGVRAQSLPIKVKSGSETVLNLAECPKVDIQLTNIDGTKLATIHAWYEYGPMVKKGEKITWDVECKDDYTPSSNQESNYDQVIHKNTLYKR